MTDITKENVNKSPCVNCPGICCSQNLINICGYDLWVIVRELSIHPSDFVGLACLNKNSLYSFLIDGSEKAYGMVLNMKELSDTTRRCIFALNLPNNVVRCGIYPLRPIACRAYPLAFAGNEVVVKPSSFCSDGAWDTSEFDSSYWQEELSRHDMEFSIYAFLLAIWNTNMQRQPELDRIDFQPFFTFLLETYKRLDSVRLVIPKDDWPRIWRQWRQFTAQKVNPLFLRTTQRRRATSWDTWLRSIKETVLEAKFTP